MNREQIIQMAREAGATPYTNRHYPNRPVHSFMPEQLERFAALVGAAEREACAKVCDTVASNHFLHDSNIGAGAAEDCAELIRARGQT